MVNLELTKVIILSGNGCDRIIFDIDRPSPVYPYKGNCTCRIDVAAEQGQTWFETNFPATDYELIKI